MRNGNRLDGYVRVSRVGGREGDGYISPKVQREKIEQWAALHDVVLGEIAVEEDVSGVRPLAERELGRLIEKCERGESDGIVVYRVDRFSRSPRDTFDAVDRLEKADARLVGVQDGVDSSAPSGELVLTVLAGIAREQWKQRRDNWGEATGRAVEDGVHISSRPPTGYRRENGKRSRLVPDPGVAPLIAEVFARRAKGASWGALAEYLSEHGVPASKTGVSGIVRNRAYLGEARGPGGLVKEGAHEALVSEEEWDAAQWQGRVYAKDGTVAAQGMLSGLITCSGCGHPLSVTASTRPKTGERIPIYFCKGHYSGSRCEVRPAAQVRVVDQYVRDAFAVALFDATLATTMDAVAQYRRAETAVAKAQADYEALASAKLLRAFGPDELARMRAEQKEVLDEARRALRDTPKPGEAVQPDIDLFGPDWDIERERALARQYIAEITLARGGKGRWSPPIGTRVAITWAGHDEPDATLAQRVEQLREDAAAVRA